MRGRRAGGDGQGELFGRPRKRQDELVEGALDSIRKDRKTFDVWERFLLEAAKRGVGVSAKLAAERVRWEMIVHERRDRGFRINNNYVTYYGRLFQLRHPDHAGALRKRKTPSAESAPRDRPDEVGAFADPDPEVEARIQQRLVAFLDELREGDGRDPSQG